MAATETNVRVVLTMVPDAELGAIIARQLIEDRLAACVNVVPGARSYYRWEGRVQDDSEVLLIIKTATSRCDELAERINALHPYDIPEILVLPADGGSRPYLNWVQAETRP
jgi:periplasmic divalent cation tolerance protein